MKYNDNGTYKDIYVKTFDTLPVGTEVDYDGETVPSGWTEVSNYDSDWILLNSGYGLYYKKVGNVVTVRAITQENKTLTGYAYTQLGNLPEKYRPSMSLRNTIYQRGNTEIYFQIAPDGNITLFNWGSEKTYEAGTLAFAITYLAD